MRRLKAERIQRQWTQEGLAARTRPPMQAADVSRIETGRMLPSPGQLRRLARALAITPPEILLDEVPPPAGAVE